MNKVETLGERKIIEVIRNQLELMPHMPVPFGDDVSAFSIGDEKLAILKTDMLVGKTDMPPQMNLHQAARKAVVMNISDFAAKGVKPTAILVSLGLPRGMTTEKDVEAIANGLNAGAREYGAYVLGGDTGEASDLVISCAVFGAAKKKAIMLRSGAQPGDVVAVTGAFGKTAAGLKILMSHAPLPAALEKRLVDSVLMPKARLSEGLALAESGAVTASIDSSDGLAWSLHELARASHVGFVIDNLPMDEESVAFARLHKLDPIELSLYGGEEYELVVTVKPSLFEKARKKVGLTRIGYVTGKKTLMLKVRGKATPIQARGWEHFKTMSPKS